MSSNSGSNLLFSQPTTGPVNIDTGQQARAVVEVGGVTMAFPMIEVARGYQKSRVNVNASLSGDMFITGSALGIGEFYVKFLDSPTIGNATNYGGWAQRWYNVLTDQGTLEHSIIKQMFYHSKLKDRIAVVRLFPGISPEWRELNQGSGALNAIKKGFKTADEIVRGDKTLNLKLFSESTVTSTPIAIFKGAVTDIELSMTEGGGTKSIVTQLTLIGAWGKDEPKFTFDWF